MTNRAVPQNTIDILGESALETLILCLRIAFSQGGFDEVVSVCKGLVEGTAKTGRPVACWAATEWKGLDSLVTKYPGFAANRRQHRQSENEVEGLPRASEVVSAKSSYIDVFKEAIEQMRSTAPDVAAYLEKAGKTATMSGFARSLLDDDDKQQDSLITKGLHR